MHRIVFLSILVCTVLLGLVGALPTGDVTHASTTANGTPAATVPAPEEVCENFDDWENADVRPPGIDDAVVMPTVEASPAPPPYRELYLVTITLPPGKCMPFAALGNQKDGAIVLIVQEGVIEYQARAYVEGATPAVEWGRMGGTVGNVELGEWQRFYPGDWITHDQQVWFTFRNVGGDPAVILKAVWAVPQSGAGCSGGCK